MNISADRAKGIRHNNNPFKTNIMKKVLFVNQDIIPYVAETELATMGRMAAQRVQEAGCEIRCFMPRWGNINERRGQLHEVIRLSGINITIDDTDHPLIIKVASIPGTKVQVYFIDNEEFFTRKAQVADANGDMFADNAERAAFFAHGVIATIKKLRWMPDVIHCQGWMSALVPFFVKKAYNEELGLDGVKVVTSLFDQPQQMEMAENAKRCFAFNETDAVAALKKYSDAMTSEEMEKIAIDYSDGVIKASANISGALLDYAKEAGKKVLDCQDEAFAKTYIDFYESL